MKNIKNSLLTLALTVVVLLSVVLSVVLWSNPSFVHSRRSNTGSSRNNLVSRPLSYTYEPTEAILTNQQGKQKLLTSPSLDEIGDIMKYVSKDKGESLKQVPCHSAHAYVHQLHKKQTLTLNYHDDITMNLFNQIVHGGFNHFQNKHITRIQILLNKSHKMYFFQDSQHKIYRVDCLQPNFKRLKKFLHRHHHGVPVNVKAHSHRPLVTYPGNVHLPSYNYLMNRQTQNYYVMHFLQGNQHITRHVNKYHQVVYRNGNNKELIFGKDQAVKCYIYHPSRHHGGLTQSLQGSYHDLLPLKLSLNNVHYFTYRPDINKIVYRKFIQGFPVFNPNQFGIVSLHYRKNHLTYRYALNNLQIPIPNTNDEIKLPSTSQVMAALKSQGYNSKKIEDLKIGYEWKDTHSSKILAKLVPTWFVEYHHHWFNYAHVAGGGF